EIVLAVVRLDLDGNGQDVDRVALALFRTQVEIEVTEQEVGSSAAESPFLFDRVIVGNAQVAVRRRTRSAHHEHDIAFLDRAELRSVSIRNAAEWIVFRQLFGAKDVWTCAGRDSNNQVARLSREAGAKPGATKC